MRWILLSATLVILLASGRLAAAGDLEVTFSDGHVTVIATDVTVLEILQEWARVGDTSFVDAESLSGAPVRLQLVDVPEADALRVLLRGAAGYVAAPRAVGAEASSRFDRVLVMATSQVAATTYVPPFDPSAPSPSPAQQAPTGFAPGLFPDPPQDFDFDELEELRELLPQPFDDFDQLDESTSQPRRGGGATATAPRPGMVVAPSEEPAVFIRRPVRPQPSDENPR